MAHQAYAIPWQTLADNFQYVHMNIRNHGITNLYLRNKNPHQGKQPRYFVRGFTRALYNYSAIERKKYNTDPVALEMNEIVISEDALKKMSKTIRQYKMGGGWIDRESSANGVECPSNEILSLYERSTGWFVNETSACEGDMHCLLQEICEQTKTMLLYGEMDALFQIAAHPNVHFLKLWDENMYANSHGFGLSRLKESALQAYICLNVMFLKPELYDMASRKAFIEKETKEHRSTFEPEQYDYRLTEAYQHMLLYCTGVPYGARHYEVHTYPHREFFGIPRGMFQFMYDDSQFGRWQKRHLGTQRIHKLVDERFKGVYVPEKSDIPVVIALMRKKGLPVKLALIIIKMAEYMPVGRTIIRDDPLHTRNGEELKKYLSFCWKILVRIEMLIKANGQWLDWEAEVANTLYTLFGMNFPICSRMENVPGYQDEDWQPDFSWRHQRRVFIS